MGGVSLGQGTGFSRVVRRVRRSRTGGVLMETVLVIPVLTILVFGTLMVGMLVGQMVWLKQSSYESYLAAGWSENQELSRQEMSRITDLFLKHINKIVPWASYTALFGTEVRTEPGNQAPIGVSWVDVETEGGSFFEGLPYSRGLNLAVRGPVLGSAKSLPAAVDFKSLGGPFNCAGQGGIQSEPCP